MLHSLTFLAKHPLVVSVSAFADGATVCRYAYATVLTWIVRLASICRITLRTL